MKDHAHVYTLARRKAHLPIVLQINVSFRSRVLNSELSSFNLVRPISMFPEIDFQHCDERLPSLALINFKVNNVLTSAERTNSR